MAERRGLTAFENEDLFLPLRHVYKCGTSGSPAIHWYIDPFQGDEQRCHVPLVLVSPIQILSNIGQGPSRYHACHWRQQVHDVLLVGLL